jgi:hypothetical protein
LAKMHCLGRTGSSLHIVGHHHPLSGTVGTAQVSSA